MNELFTRKIHFPKFKTKSKKTGKYSEILISLNNIPRWYRWKKSEIKNEYKSMLKEFYIPEPELKYKTLVLQYRILRHTKTRFDQDNAIFAIKFILDTLEDMQYIDDDRYVNIQSFPTLYDKSLSETMIEIRVLNGESKW